MLDGDFMELKETSFEAEIGVVLTADLVLGELYCATRNRFEVTREPGVDNKACSYNSHLLFSVLTAASSSGVGEAPCSSLSRAWLVRGGVIGSLSMWLKGREGVGDEDSRAAISVSFLLVDGGDRGGTGMLKRRSGELLGRGIPSSLNGAGQTCRLFPSNQRLGRSLRTTSWFRESSNSTEKIW
jgi:hypothetical protein